MSRKSCFADIAKIAASSAFDSSTLRQRFSLIPTFKIAGFQCVTSCELESQGRLEPPSCALLFLENNFSVRDGWADIDAGAVGFKL